MTENLVTEPFRRKSAMHEKCDLLFSPNEDFLFVKILFDLFAARVGASMVTAVAWHIAAFLLAALLHVTGSAEMKNIRSLCGQLLESDTHLPHLSKFCADYSALQDSKYSPSLCLSLTACLLIKTLIQLSQGFQACNLFAFTRKHLFEIYVLVSIKDSTHVNGQFASKWKCQFSHVV